MGVAESEAESETEMPTVRHRYPMRTTRPDPSGRTTIWWLVAVIVALVVALTFGNADGFGVF